MNEPTSGTHRSPALLLGAVTPARAHQSSVLWLLIGRAAPVLVRRLTVVEMHVYFLVWLPGANSWNSHCRMLIFIMGRIWPSLPGAGATQAGRGSRHNPSSRFDGQNFAAALPRRLSSSPPAPKTPGRLRSADLSPQSSRRPSPV